MRFVAIRGGYAQGVSEGAGGAERVLLIDTCGEAAGVALCCGPAILHVEEFAERAASAGIVGAVRRLLQAEGWALAQLDGVGVVNGPGSFTGVRAGLAAAKGLCEAASLPLAAVSRLAVLAKAAKLDTGFAVLSAGRDELYVRDLATGREWMCGADEFSALAEGAQVVVAEASVAERLAEMRPLLHVLRVGDALELVRESLREGGCDLVTIDANYVRGEGEIYRKHGGTSKSGAGAQ